MNFQGGGREVIGSSYSWERGINPGILTNWPLVWVSDYLNQSFVFFPHTTHTPHIHTHTHYTHYTAHTTHTTPHTHTPHTPHTLHTQHTQHTPHTTSQSHYTPHSHTQHTHYTPHNTTHTTQPHTTHTTSPEQSNTSSRESAPIHWSNTINMLHCDATMMWCVFTSPQRCFSTIYYIFFSWALVNSIWIKIHKATFRDFHSEPNTQRSWSSQKMWS